LQEEIESYMLQHGLSEDDHPASDEEEAAELAAALNEQDSDDVGRRRTSGTSESSGVDGDGADGAAVTAQLLQLIEGSTGGDGDGGVAALAADEDASGESAAAGGGRASRSGTSSSGGGGGSGGGGRASARGAGAPGIDAQGPSDADFLRSAGLLPQLTELPDAVVAAAAAAAAAASELASPEISYETGPNTLLQAIREGDAERVRHLLELGHASGAYTAGPRSLQRRLQGQGCCRGAAGRQTGRQAA
jgi:hypothetical protein